MANQSRYGDDATPSERIVVGTWIFPGKYYCYILCTEDYFIYFTFCFAQGSIKFASSVIQSAILFTFNNKVVAETFASCMITGKAQYLLLPKLLVSLLF